MNWPAPIFCRQPRPHGGRILIARQSGRLILELGCWIAGIALIAIYLIASASLENQRSQGIELFAQTRAAAMVSDQIEVHPLAVEPAWFEEAPTLVPTPATAIVEDTASMPIAVLRMASIGLEVPVYSDSSELNLSRGAGWIEGTAPPNSSGNMAVAAHRDRFFRPLKDVKIGDILELESLSGPREFRVSRIVIVDPDDVSVLDDTLVPTLTLVTCYPFYFIGNAPQRYIVQATAVEQSGKASVADVILTAQPSGDTS